MVNSVGTLDATYHDGLASYLIDNVEIGGIEQAAGSITILAGLATGETVTINGVVFSAVNFGAEVAAAQTFSSVTSPGGSIAATHASLIATINDPVSVGLMELGTISGSYAFAAGASPTVTLVARYGAGLTLTGWAGNMALANSLAAHVTLSGTRMTRTHETWTKALQTALCAAFLARVDTGLTFTLSDANGELAALVGADLTGTTDTSGSRGSVADILAILAGRTYRIPQTTLTGTLNYYMDSTYPTFKWAGTAGPFGGFTQPVLVGGDTMQYGEVKPSAIGGGIENREVAGIRHTYNIDAVVASLVSGQLDVLTGPVTMWPTSNVIPHFPYNLSGFTSFDTTTASRLVTVYDDDGTVLS